MMIDVSSLGGVSGIAAAIGLVIHVAIYANKEGKKEQRLTAVEDRTKNLPALEVAMATIGSNVANLGGKVDSLKSDIKLDIQEINRTIRECLVGASNHG